MYNHQLPTVTLYKARYGLSEDVSSSKTTACNKSNMLKNMGRNSQEAPHDLKLKKMRRINIIWIFSYILNVQTNNGWRLTSQTDQRVSYKKIIKKKLTAMTPNLQRKLSLLEN